MGVPIAQINSTAIPGLRVRMRLMRSFTVHDDPAVSMIPDTVNAVSVFWRKTKC